MPLPNIEKAIAQVSILRAARAKDKKNLASGSTSRA